jgi:protein TonB
MSGMSSGGGLIGGVSSSAPSGAVSVSSGTMAGALISRPQPVYPALAKAARVQGAVILRALISKTGDIEDLSVVSGPPMLTASALEAVRRWKYKPYLLQGVPVDVQTTITVNFTFSDNPTSDQAPAAAATPSPQN